MQIVFKREKEQWRMAMCSGLRVLELCMVGVKEQSGSSATENNEGKPQKLIRARFLNQDRQCMLVTAFCE